MVADCNKSEGYRAWRMSALPLWDALEQNSMEDIGFHGPKFTWSNI